MPATEVITIINNSGKIISTGKHLVNIFKEAQAAYRDKRDAVKAERAATRRAKTYPVAKRGDPYYDDYDDYHRHRHRHRHRLRDDTDHADDGRSLRDAFGRRRSHDDDDRSHASSRHSHHSRRSRRPRSSSRPRPVLTESNLKTLSEVSATSASKAYRSPYAETAPRDMQLSRPTLALPPGASPVSSPPVSAPDRLQLVHRPPSDPSPVERKSIDMNLAYGNIPPDLASRTDLDPAHAHGGPEPEDPQEAQVRGLTDRIEDFLEQADCVHHTASYMIESLQRNPEAAAAVALSLAELSSLLAKMSPAFLTFLKSGSPAVFALLASPQFLIGAGVAVGVTVVMFGGWRIVKRIKDSGKTLEAPLEMRTGSAQPVPAAGTTSADEKAQPASAASYNEALVLQDVEELGTIETWRRGIVPFGEDESADVELMSREAERALRDKYRDDIVDPGDSVSQADRSVRSHRSHRSHRSSQRHRPHREQGDVEMPERKSSRQDGGHRGDKDGARSEAASERSRRSHGEGSTVTLGLKAIAGRSHGEGSTVMLGLKAISEGRQTDGGDGGSASARPKEKKRDMIKHLFKIKKEKEDRERAVSVLV